MAEYQNIFTRVQVRGPAEPGVELPRGSMRRDGTPFFVYWFGKLGDAQIGPIYLGYTGIASLVIPPAPPSANPRLSAFVCVHPRTSRF